MQLGEIIKNRKIELTKPKGERSYYIDLIVKEVQKHNPKYPVKGILGKIFNLKPCTTVALRDFYYQMLKAPRDNPYYKSTAHYFFCRTKT